MALDDFGTGFASLTHLKQYPVDVLKIDRSFASKIELDAGNAAIVDAIVKLGGSFVMEVVAEGVETAAPADFPLNRGGDHRAGISSWSTIAGRCVPSALFIIAERQ